MKNIYQVYNVGMLEFFQKCDLPDGCARDAFLLRLKFNLFKRINLVSFVVSCLVYHAVGSLANDIKFCVSVSFFLTIHF